MADGPSNPGAGGFQVPDTIVGNTEFASDNGRPVMAHLNPDGKPDTAFEDPDLPDHSADIAAAFGLGSLSSSEGPGGATASPAQAPSGNGAGGEAAPPPSAPAAEGSPGQPAPGTPAPPAQPAGVQPSQVPPPQQPPATPGSAEAPAGQPALSPEQELVVLRAQVQRMEQLLKQPTTPGAQPGQPGSPPASEDSAPTPEQLRNYQVTVPDDVVGAIFQDDANLAKRGIEHLMNSFGKLVHERVVLHVDQLLNQRLDALTQVQEARTTQQQIESDYYGAFPQHNTPAFRQVVQSEAARMWSENPNLTWDPTNRNALGARVNAALKLDQQQPPAPPAPPPPPPPPQRHAKMLNGGGQREPSQGSVPEGQTVKDILQAF